MTMLIARSGPGGGGSGGADPVKTVRTTCAYCGVGCGIEAKVNEYTREVSVNGDEIHQANFGRLCSKGSSLGETIDVEGRLLHPSINGEQVSWDTALDTVAQRFRAVIDEHGPDAVAFYGSGQLLTEDYYVANKLMKGFIGSGNMDTNSRLCMSSAVSGHKRAYGTDTVANCYDDVELADLVVIVGSNTAWCHPIVFQRLRTAKERNPDMKVVVVDPRRTATCDIADLHLPIASGADVKLFNGLLTYLAEQDQQQGNVLDSDYIDSHCEGFDEALAAAKADAPTIEAVADYCDLNADDVKRYYQWVKDTDKTVTLFSQGVKQSSSGVDKVNSITNSHMAMGRIGKPGSGALSLTGQPNAMGGREVGGLATTLAAHMEFHIPGDRERVAKFWNTNNLAEGPGLPAVDLFNAVADGKVKAIWIMGTNPVVSMPNADKIKAALKGCDTVVVSDCVARTDTLDLAHIKLPAVGWSEKDGMVTNSERRVSHQRALLPPAGEAKPDWWILSQVGQRMGYREAFDYDHQVEIFREHAALSGYENNPMQRPRAFDISGLADISLEEYQNFKPTQWPINKSHPKGKQRFFANGHFFTPNTKGQFQALTTRAPGNRPDKRYPLVLNTGRLRDQWHTMTRSALAPRLNQHRPEPFVEVHPQDAEQYKLENGGIAHLQSQWGQMYARVMITDAQKPGDVFVPMHWTEQYARSGRMGALVNPVVDPLSCQPESKHTPINIRPFKAKWYGFVMSRQPLPELEIEYQVKVKGEGYYRYELAGMALPAELEGKLTSEKITDELSGEDFGLLAKQSLQPKDDWQWQEFLDPRQGIFRAASYSDGKDDAHRLESLFVAAPAHLETVLPARAFMGSVFAKDSLKANERIALLAGVPTAGVEDVGAIICSCNSVGEKTIIKAIIEKGLCTHQQIGECTKAGTNCGSCVPELKSILAKHAMSEAS